ncbi:MAG: ABC transporter permease, partial [Acidobacteriota bacterium]
MTHTSQTKLLRIAAFLVDTLSVSILLVLPVSILLGATFGALNGALVAGLRLPSIVVTLATLVSLREAVRWWRQGQFITLPEG